MSYPAERAPADVLLVEDDPGDVPIILEAFGEQAIRGVLHVVTDGEQAFSSSATKGSSATLPGPG